MPGWSWPEDLVKLRQRFLTAEPYPHLVLDGVFAAEALNSVFEEVPSAASALWTAWGSGWGESDGDRNQKRGISSLFLLGERTAKFLQQLNSHDFLADVRQLTDEPELTADATFNGGGLHCTGRGGRLRIHVDKVRHPRPDRFDQAVNLIVFVNPVCPEALQCPEGEFRTTIATYYYVPRKVDSPLQMPNEIGWRTKG